MPFELSAEEMRAPLRSVAISLGAGEREQLLGKLRIFSNGYGFAIRLSGDPAKPGDIFVQLYRTDIKMIGRLPAAIPRLDLTVYRTWHRVPAEGVEQGVGGLRQSVSSLPGVRFEQTIFERGDDMSLEPRDGRAPVRSARIALEDRSRDALKLAFARFAEASGMAIRFTQSTPDPKNLVVMMHREDVDIIGTMPFSTQVLEISISRSGDRTASQAVIDQTFEALRRSVEQVAGLTFTERR